MPMEVSLEVYSFSIRNKGDKNSILKFNNFVAGQNFTTFFTNFLNK